MIVLIHFARNKMVEFKNSLYVVVLLLKVYNEIKM